MGKPTGELEYLKPDDRKNQYLYLKIAAPENKSIEIQHIKKDADVFSVHYAIQLTPAKTEPKQYVLFEADSEIIDIFTYVNRHDFQDIRLFYD